MDKIDRLFDAMEHPENYTPTEIEAMLQDPEVKEVFDLLDKTKASLQTFTTPDIDDEWERFEEKQRASRKLKMNWVISLFSRNAAASIAIAIASFTAVAALVGVGIHHIQRTGEVTAKEIEVISKSKPNATPSETSTQVDENGPKIVEVVVFDNEPFKTIADKIAEYYGYEVEFNNEDSKSLRLYFRWNQDNTLEDVVESLNHFEQIHIVIKDMTIKID